MRDRSFLGVEKHQRSYTFARFQHVDQNLMQVVLREVHAILSVMSLTGNNTPGRVSVLADEPPYSVIRGQETTAEIDASELTNEYIAAYQVGLRDLRNPALEVFYRETPRSRVSQADLGERYRAVVDAANAFDASPASVEGFVSFFLPDGARGRFVSHLGFMGMELTFHQDVQRLSAAELAFRNAATTRLVGEQVRAGRVPLQAALIGLLADIGKPLDVDQTLHFVDDAVENDGLEADRKAHERLFSDFGGYILAAVRLA